MGDAGFEPAASAVRRQHDGLLELSGACKTPANSRISVLNLFPSFQEIYSGCCTVAAQGWDSRRRIGPSKKYNYPTRASPLSFCPSAPRVSNLHDIACLSTLTACGGEAPRWMITIGV